MKKYITSGLALSVILALSGCSDSDDSGSSSQVTTGTGYYVDSAVEGVNYQCGSLNGITDAEGMFTFVVGQECILKLGDIVLKTIPSDELLDDVTIVEDNITVATFLQTVDVDGNASNGIKIIPAVGEALSTDLITSVPKDTTELDEVFNTLSNNSDYRGRVVTETEAEEHLKITQTNVIKNMLGGKTVYAVNIQETSHALNKVTFDQNMTATTWHGLIPDSGMDISSSIELDGNKIIKTYDDSYVIVERQYTDYILTSGYNADGSVKGTSYMFSTLSAAEAFYNAKYPPAPTPSTLSFDTLKGQNLVNLWEDGYDLDTFDGSEVTFKEYDTNDSLINTETASVTITSAKTATLTSDQGSVYNMTLMSIEDVSSYNGVDLSSYDVKKITHTYTCIQSGTPTFEPSAWIPTYWDGNSSQPITDTATYVNQLVTDDTDWWFEDDSGIHKYMYATHTQVNVGDVVSGNIVRADANGTISGCTGSEDDCAIYVRTDTVVGTWSLNADGVLKEDVPNEYGNETKFVDGKMQEAYVDIVGESGTTYRYLGLTPELINQIMSESN